MYWKLSDDQFDLWDVGWSNKFDITFQWNQKFAYREASPGISGTDVGRAHHPDKG